MPYHAPLHPGRVLTTFGMLSGVVEALNAIGVSYIANRSLPDDKTNVGQILMKVSLILQIVVICLFCLLAGTFQHRCSAGGIKSKNVFRPLFTTYISTTLILIRCIYRTVEHFDPSNIMTGKEKNLQELGPMLRHEWFFYVFEATLMLLNAVLWNVLHPRRYLPEKSETYLAQDGCTELEGPGWNDGRGFLMTLIDPFGFIPSEKSGKPPFWETNGYTSVNNGNV